MAWAAEMGEGRSVDRFGNAMDSASAHAPIKRVFRLVFMEASKGKKKLLATLGLSFLLGVFVGEKIPLNTICYEIILAALGRCRDGCLRQGGDAGISPGRPFGDRKGRQGDRVAE